MKIAPFGERALLVSFGDRIDPASNARARALADAWESRGLGPAVPTYASTLLHFDPVLLDGGEAMSLAGALARRRVRTVPPAASRLVEVTVRYDGEDLAEVARLSRLSVDELVALHSGREYRAYFLGFLPGFAYLASLDPRITAPRLPAPRPRVPAGSVAVADGQTAVYPFATPGGWRLLGSTDAVPFDPARAEPSLIRPGDRVRFVPA